MRTAILAVKNYSENITLTNFQQITSAIILQGLLNKNRRISVLSAKWLPVTATGKRKMRQFPNYFETLNKAVIQVGIIYFITIVCRLV
jgi:hypothetical protein